MVSMASIIMWWKKLGGCPAGDTNLFRSKLLRSDALKVIFGSLFCHRSKRPPAGRFQFDFLWLLWNPPTQRGWLLGLMAFWAIVNWKCVTVCFTRSKQNRQHHVSVFIGTSRYINNSNFQIQTSVLQASKKALSFTILLHTTCYSYYFKPPFFCLSTVRCRERKISN